jgi:NAD(P)-dependent dehydrogenase (short-subunit alcohol dehydrogenase family)
MKNGLLNFDGKTALVTGASRGIGEAIARGLAARGAHIIVSSRKQESCESIVNSIRESGGSADAMACHIGNISDMTSLFLQIEKRYGKLNCLVNNAATNPYFGPILDTDASAFQKTVDVNIRGYFLMSQLAGNLMKTHGGGSILNVASVFGRVPGSGQGIYSITKAAVISMTQAFAKECAPLGIRVNALLPGATNTKFAAAIVQNPAILKQALRHIPMKRVAEPDEMTAAALYLLSDDASYTTGSCLTVDGGYLLE